MPTSSLLRVLAASFLAGQPSAEQIEIRCAQVLGRKWHWLKPLAKRYVKTFAVRTRPRRRDVIEFLTRDEGFQRAWSKYSEKLSIAQWIIEPQQMQPAAVATAWPVPQIESVGALAEWLGVTIGELEWFADLKGLAYKRRIPRLEHYRYRILSKQFGSVRVIESPKPPLKALQRQILTQILEKIPPHRAAHGFLKRRSIKTFVAPHIGQRVLLKMDLQDFFPSVTGARIQSLFRTIGYPEAVADLLGGICTNAVPRNAWKGADADVDRSRLHEARSLYAAPHSPQGAPTSPALANICCYRVDCRLTGLAKSVGAEYTRYADDLAFSGDDAFERKVERFSIHVAAILMTEGFRVHHRKTRIMRQGVRQHLAGVVLNDHLNVMRNDFDRLKATLTNCVRRGPESQNRAAHAQFRAHLEGRVGFVETINPAKGRRLRALYEQIRWP
ncbi:MAG: reverse transcriptase family protein [Candidatus Acidiferrales bacterium]